MKNLVRKLRQHALPDPYDEREVMHAPLLTKAADRIEAQDRLIAELVELLQKSKCGNAYCNNGLVPSTNWMQAIHKCPECAKSDELIERAGK